MALGNASATLVQQFDQPPPPPEIHPELVEEGPVSKVMLVGDYRQRGYRGGNHAKAPNTRAQLSQVQNSETSRAQTKQTSAEQTGGDQGER